MKKGITSRQYNFLKNYIDIESPTFGNAYQSALKVGYTNVYSRVIKRYFSPWRMKLIKNQLKDDDLVTLFKAFETFPDDHTVGSVIEMRGTITKSREKFGELSLPEIIKELDELFK